jgi:outer membrane receptor protein involved in Fe transport
MRAGVRFFLCFIFVMFLCSICSSQTSTGTISGSVTDQSGAAVAGAQITIKNELTGANRQTVSDSAGLYQAPFLPAGHYSIDVSAAGFQTIIQTGVNLDVQQALRLDIALRVQSQNQAVTVNSTPGLLNVENSTVGTLITNTEVIELPLNGRNFNQLSLLSPGVTEYGSGGASIGFGGQLGITLSINGGRWREESYLIDGMQNWSQWFYSTSVDPSVDVIQEFRIQTASYSAEYGLGSGTVTVAIKSGTNSFHGTAYEYNKDPSFDARNFFSPTVNPLKRNQFGGTVGGPIIKNHTFFFFGYEGVRETQGVTLSGAVPSAQEIQGIFPFPITDPTTGLPFPNNTIPTNRLDPVAQLAIQKFYPIPANTGCCLVTYTSSSPLDNNQYTVKADQQFGTRDSLFFRWMWYSQSSEPIFGPGLMDYFNVYDAGNEGVGWTHTFSSSLVNNLQFSHRREELNQINVLPATGGKTYSFVQAAGIQGMPDPTSSGSPYFSVPGLGAVGSYFVPAIIPFNTYEISDTVEKIRGKHTLKTGIDWARLHQNTQSLYISGRGVYTYTGQYTGNGLADFLLGAPQSVSAAGQPPPAYLQYTNFAAFVADDWKVLPNLTLNLGLRWSLQTPPVETHDMLESFDYQTGKVVVAGRNGTFSPNANPVILNQNPGAYVTAKEAGYPLRSLRDTNYHDFEPRFGFAWQVRPTWVVRGGYGISYMPTNAFSQFSQSYSAPFTGATYGILNTQPVPTVSTLNPFLGVPNGTVISAGPYIASGVYYPVSNPDSYIQQISLGVEKQLGKNQTIELGYVGMMGTHIVQSFDGFNYPAPGPGPIQARRPFPDVGAFTTIQNNGRSHYNSLQLTYTRRFSQGLSVTSAFTWSKCIDAFVGDPNSASLYAGLADLNKAVGNCDYNIPLRWVSSYVYELPFGQGKRFLNHGGWLNQVVGGWTTTGILTFQSGLPFTPYIEGDPANVGQSEALPERVCSGKLSDPTLNDWFNVNCFEPPGDTNLPLNQRTQFFYGNSGRNILQGPDYKNLDFGLYKNFFIKENIKLQFRFEAFNVLNHPNFNAPYAGLIVNKVPGETTAQLNPNAGIITSAQDPRIIQLAVRLDF